MVLTDLRRLRDSHPIYSGFWRMFGPWFGTSPGGLRPHPFAKDAPPQKRPGISVLTAGMKSEKHDDEPR